MSIELVARAKKTKLGPKMAAAKLLLIVLADYANDDRMAWPSVRTLMDEVELGKRQVQRLLRELESRGLIVRGNQELTRNYPKYQRPTVYEVLPEKANRTRKPRVTHDTTPGDVEDTTPGVTEDTRPVSPMTPAPCHAGRKPRVTHDTQTVIETTNKPSRESTRANENRKTSAKPSERSFELRLKLLDRLTPNEEHRQLAERYGLDLERELAKFKSKLRSTGELPYSPNEAFTNWLLHGPELKNTGTSQTMTALAGDGAEPVKAHTHTWRCSHVLHLLQRSQDTANEIGPDDASCRLATLLNRGLTDAEALSELGLQPDELEAIA